MAEEGLPTMKKGGTPWRRRGLGAAEGGAAVGGGGAGRDSSEADAGEAVADALGGVCAGEAVADAAGCSFRPPGLFLLLVFPARC